MKNTSSRSKRDTAVADLKGKKEKEKREAESAASAQLAFGLSIRRLNCRLKSSNGAIDRVGWKIRRRQEPE